MAVKVVWGPALKADYERLFKACQVLPNRKPIADIWAKKIFANKARYEGIGKPMNIPWWVIGVIHQMECGLSFEKHLHNGDPLTKRTVRVPAGYPLPSEGNPPFTFEVSAKSALKKQGFATNTDWSIGRLLFMFEGFNGYGYRQYHPEVNSPYLWSFTNLYTKGKYVDDGKYNKEAVSLQLGIAAVIKRMVELGMIKI